MYYIRFVYETNIYKAHSSNNTFLRVKIKENKSWKKIARRKSRFDLLKLSLLFPFNFD